MPATLSHRAPEEPSRAWRRFRRSLKAWLGLGVIAAFVLAALLADFVAPYAANEADPAAVAAGRRGDLLPPSPAHPLGTDSNEYDVLSRVIYGSRLSLLAGLVSILIAVTIATPAGLVAGYFGRWADTLIMRSIDVMLAFPSILIALLVLIVLPRGWTPVILAVGLINVPVFARQVRATILGTQGLDYVLAARAAGAGNFYIMRRVLLPSCINPIVVLATLGLGSAILEVAGLSFLGFGGDAGDAEWGAMLNEAKDHFHTSIWPAVGPGLAISLAVLGFNLLGDGLRDALDPRLEAASAA